MAQMNKNRTSGRQQAVAAADVRRKRRRRGRYTLHYILLVLAASAVMMVLSLTVFFKVEQIEVTGTTKYAAAQIIENSGIAQGDNLFRISQKKVQKNLTDKFPYVEKVALKRSFPPKITIAITQEKPLGAVETGAGYVIISRSGKVLEIGAQSLPENMTIVTGMSLDNPQEGKLLGEGSDEGMKMLTYLVDAIGETEFDKITKVDFSDRLNIVVTYDNRILIELGSEANLPYKLKFVKLVISEKLEDNFEGRLDASIEKEVWMIPEDINQEPVQIEVPLDPEDLATLPVESGADSEQSSSRSGPVDAGLPVNPDLSAKGGTNSKGELTAIPKEELITLPKEEESSSSETSPSQ